MSYLQFYGLKEEPFSNAPVSHFYYPSKQHAEALIRLRHATDRMKGLALLVGDIGAGKTTLARRFLESLPENEFEAALLVIIHTGISANWLLRRIAQQLGVANPAQEKLQILSQLYRRLLQIAEGGKKAVVIIDEAQMLKSRELMEEFRGLLNLEIPGQKLITFVFFGLPDLEENLKLDPPLRQRIALKYNLDALDSDTTKSYILHRLKLAGAAEDIFDDEALDAIFQYSQGYPRLVNTIADNALFEGAILKASRLGRGIIDNIAVDLGISAARKRDLRIVQVEEVSLSEKTPPPESFVDISEGLKEDTGRTSPEPPYERDVQDVTEDIDQILSGLEEKV